MPVPEPTRTQPPTGGIIQSPDGTKPPTVPLTPQQAVSQGLEWVPQDHPLYGTSGYVGHTAAPPPAPPAGDPGAAPGTDVPAPANQALQAPVTAGAEVQQGQPTTVAGAFQQALVNQLAPAPVNAQAPEIAPAITANRGAEQRAMERGRAQLAEQAASQGLDQNAFGSQLRGLNAESAQRQGQFEGQAVQQLGRDRMQQIQSALALSGSLMGDQDRMALQRELAQLQAQLTREGLSAQTGLGQADISTRRDLGFGQLNLGLLNALLGNQQFGQGLASSNALATQQLNQQALGNALGWF